MEKQQMHSGAKKAHHVAAQHGAKWLRSKHASAVLAFISFAESVFAPIIIDPFLVALILASPKKWKWYVCIAIVFSIVGGVFAYALGLLFFDTIGTKLVEFYRFEDQSTAISQSLNNNGFAFVLLGAFTPIPYKLVAIASGFLQINILTFIVASIFGRIFRLGLVGFAAYTVGPRALPAIQRNLHLLAGIIGIILLTYIIVRIFL